ncbi:GNAT family N-acetyltransferase [Siphonobacter sp. SORGH_AS_1065]|uniref:GNAT family N-acetyltransferase n=1 Tax=Siphonobacter sp. SORGH_AS_1065 TaxID=3041795 RepID=UPI00278AFBED|nr:GNAT family N-acetyltransferase [Siphonobacter sp. SORGH_AS_1065]MDQ1089268.1 putative acetyltransferase [Siphonobacter sp. SORGH_AS_1065]
MVFRLIQPSDNKRLAEIIRSGIEEFGVPLEGTAHTDPTTDDLYMLFRKSGSVYWVAEVDGLILGGCGISPTPGLPDGCAELVRFFLSPEARGKGIGKYLMQRCFETAITLGYRQLYLETFPEMSSAVGMYEHMGFYYIPQALGNSGHYSCTIWMLKDL